MLGFRLVHNNEGATWAERTIAPFWGLPMSYPRFLFQHPLCRTFLIVDDEQSICGIDQAGKSPLGHTAAVAPSAEQAFAAAEKQRPDAIV